MVVIVVVVMEGEFEEEMVVEEGVAVVSHCEYAQACVHARMHARVHACVHARVHACMRACVCVCVCVCVRACVRIKKHAASCHARQKCRRDAVCIRTRRACKVALLYKTLQY